MKYKNQPLRNAKKHWLYILLCTLVTIGGCTKMYDWHFGGHSEKPDENIKTLLLWNQAATVAWTAASAATGPSPMVESHLYAIVNIAMYDALNSIHPQYKTYALSAKQPGYASVSAAIATAAHDAIVNLFPDQFVYADSLLAVTLAGVPEGVAKQKGIEAGKAAASAIISKRTNDGSETAQSTPFIQGTLPGQYRSTPPFDGPPFNGFAQDPGWGNVKTFAGESSSQFRPVAPFAVNSADYTSDYNDVKTLGAVTGSTRTAEQTQIALFWLPSAPYNFNQIACTVIISKNIETWKASRLLTLVAIAEADANIGAFEAKYYYHFWRPITAIRLGDADGNASTTGDAAWDVLAPPTPPVPDYPSNHSVNGAAGAEVLKDFFGTDNISFDMTSSTLPGVTRHYTSFSQAAMENALSRVYVGFHFRNACLKGLEQGKKIGKYVFDHQLNEE